jgi:hypothetical protein
LLACIFQEAVFYSLQALAGVNKNTLVRDGGEIHHPESTDNAENAAWDWLDFCS